MRAAKPSDDLVDRAPILGSHKDLTPSAPLLLRVELIEIRRFIGNTCVDLLKRGHTHRLAPARSADHEFPPALTELPDRILALQ